MKILELFKIINPYDSRIANPYIIAEAGVNHEGNMDLAKRLIDEACEGGADAIKFQTYKAESIASKNSPAYWDITKEPTKSQFELFQKYDTFQKSDYEELKKHCDKVGIEFLSTPFDVESAKFLNDMVDVFKISSSDITNKPFIEYICQFGKPIILSTGASYLHEIQEAVEWIDDYDVPVALLHCVLNYPTLDENANLGMITGLQQKFPDKLIGYSDHTLPKDMKTLETAFLLGAVILEKHFTHDKTLPGNDHYHAMDKNDLKLFKQNIKRSLSLLGNFKVTALPIEEQARKNARRSLVAKRNIPKGKIVEYKDLTWKRPGHGISPRFIDEVIGKRTIVNMDEDVVLQWNHLATKTP
ncbi:MAG: N-acetylneuraminate synthase family protein [Bacteroidales bacterium]|nr:N-acetylneuraminate synthase family protein [Bacteroidales bacterium]